MLNYWTFQGAFYYTKFSILDGCIPTQNYYVFCPRKVPPGAQIPFPVVSISGQLLGMGIRIYCAAEVWSWMIFQPLGNFRKIKVKRP